MKLSDLNLLDIGNSIQISGVVYSGQGKNFICLFPGEESNKEKEIHFLDMNLADWQAFIQQSDIVETEVLAQAKDKTMTKAIVRKAERQISAKVSWTVFKRDNYSCRYCGVTGCPITVDHLIPWEDCGPSIEENLVTACKTCNRTRGDTKYVDWINGEYYKSVSKNLLPGVHEQNLLLVEKIVSIKRNVRMRSR